MTKIQRFSPDYSQARTAANTHGRTSQPMNNAQANTNVNASETLQAMSQGAALDATAQHESADTDPVQIQFNTQAYSQTGGRLAASELTQVAMLNPESSVVKNFPKIKPQEFTAFIRTNFNRMSRQGAHLKKSDVKAAMINPSFSLSDKVMMARVLDHWTVFQNQKLEGVDSDLTPGLDFARAMGSIEPITRDDMVTASQKLSNGKTREFEQVLNTNKTSLSHIKFTDHAGQVKASGSVREWSDLDAGKYAVDLATGNKQNIHDFKMQWIKGYKEVINDAAKEYDIPPLLLAGVADAELGGDPPIIDPLAYEARKIIPIGKAADRTSFGNISMQVDVAAETLGYPNFRNLPPGQANSVIMSVQNPNENIYLAAKHLARLSRTDFSKTPSSQLSDDQIRQIAPRWMRGQTVPLSDIRANAGYADQFLKHKQAILEALSGH